MARAVGRDRDKCAQYSGFAVVCPNDAARRPERRPVRRPLYQETVCERAVRLHDESTTSKMYPVAPACRATATSECQSRCLRSRDDILALLQRRHLQGADLNASTSDGRHPASRSVARRISHLLTSKAFSQEQLGQVECLRWQIAG